MISEAQVSIDGFAQLTELPAGTYSVIGSANQGGPAAATTQVAVGLNQEITIQLVLSSAIDSVLARVEYQISAAALRPVPSAQITITGVIGYNGSVPTRDQMTFATDTNGSVALCTVAADGCDQVLPLVEESVDVRVTATGFDDYAANGVTLGSLASIQLVPSAPGARRQRRAACPRAARRACGSRS